MLIKEFRIPLPLKVEEFRRGLLYSVSEASKCETGGGEGAEFVKQYDFFDDTTIKPGKKLSGIYSYKIYRVKSKVPWILQKLLPEEAFEIHEESWNAYPYCKTVLTNPGYMGQNSSLIIESTHLPDNGSSENPLNIKKKRDVVYLDICDDEIIGEANYKPEFDPKIFLSELVTIQFKWIGLGSLVEKTILKQYTKIFSNFHRCAFCWIDSWFDLTDEEIQEFEDETARQLQQLVTSEEKRGVSFDD
ncbi:unnamed protein product [Haemonchus placei]|uniref:Phosphatidylinositol transfer protein n=1 Tax=Haemonchus placei TaxID=6290 RepID=A0A0N4WEV5_HAEPC|nr:unnamed protein product [Haemonchus placei]